MKLVNLVIVSFVMLCAATEVSAQQHYSLDEYYARIDFDSREIRAEEISPGLYVLYGWGGNLAASIGDQGALIVDDQVPQMVPKIRAAIQDLGGDGIDFVVNTHWHFDHAYGNTPLGESGSWIVSQRNTRDVLSRDVLLNMVDSTLDHPAVPPAGLPVITFDNRMQFHFNGEQIDLLHFGPAHTGGDAAVFFHARNAVHMGDVFNNAGYPFIDADGGGDLNGLIRFCEDVLAEITADTVIIPGHGPLAGYQDLENYVAMLSEIRDRIAAR